MTKFQIDLSKLMCPEGHTTLEVFGVDREIIEVRCTTCDLVYEEGDLLPREEWKEEPDGD